MDPESNYFFFLVTQRVGGLDGVMEGVDEQDMDPSILELVQKSLPSSVSPNTSSNP